MSPRVLRKLVYAGSRAASFAEANELLGELAEVSIHAERVRRACGHVGDDLIDAQRRLQEAYREKSLPDQTTRRPADVAAPEIACVMVDGGRYQRLDRQPGAQTRQKLRARKRCGGPPRGSARKGKHWKESRIALLATMSGPRHAVDPQPQLPASLCYAAAAEKLAQIGKTGRKLDDSGEAEEEAAADFAAHEASPAALEDAAIAALASREDAPRAPLDPPPRGRFQRAPTPSLDPLTGTCATIAHGVLARDVAAAEVDAPDDALDDIRPKLQQRCVVASRCTWREFGPLVASQAWYRGFAAAPRKVFVSDGSATIEKLQQQHFSHYTSVLDLLHGLSYALAAARAVALDAAAAEQQYDAWAALIWSGRVADVLAELAVHAARLGSPDADASDTDPREVVRRAQVFFTNHQSRMNYPAYRCEGFPLTSSLMESTVKQVSRRVKGTEKFWSSPGAEAMRRLRAASLSDDRPLDRYFTHRTRHARGTRTYRPKTLAMNT